MREWVLLQILTAVFWTTSRVKMLSPSVVTLNGTYSVGRISLIEQQRALNMMWKSAQHDVEIGCVDFDYRDQKILQRQQNLHTLNSSLKPRRVQRMTSRLDLCV